MQLVDKETSFSGQDFLIANTPADVFRRKLGKLQMGTR